MTERLYINDVDKEELMSFCQRAVHNKRAVYLGMTARRFYFFMSDKSNEDDWICCFYSPHCCMPKPNVLYDDLYKAIEKLERQGIKRLADETRNAVWNGVMAYTPQ